MKEEHKIITAGPVVTLPCQPPNDRSILAVEWTRADLGYKYVVLYRAGHFDSVIGFKNRVDLQQGNIINLSVVDPPGQTGGHTEDGSVGMKFLFREFMAVVCVVGVLVMFSELPLKMSLVVLLVVVMVLLLFF
ncbi:uncharacterized protein LOC102292361 isoform X2 [Haplochromis burtoni]|uniref:uncharacterized protein LOC102292361 isoform X2 n=1 Tax=Haplochromis burtoni TaxID=8153 RepID=UPI001C2D3A20|nr:uncharacterized protein LOC102292361 isoform X2 [Haplochromis burtoni]XP_042071046.1 uncharacterized protein LOC102292361 isoform X2 [Haplochromis burtoni]